MVGFFKVNEKLFSHKRTASLLKLHIVITHLWLLFSSALKIYAYFFFIVTFYWTYHSSISLTRCRNAVAESQWFIQIKSCLDQCCPKRSLLYSIMCTHFSCLETKTSFRKNKPNVEHVCFTLISFHYKVSMCSFHKRETISNCNWIKWKYMECCFTEYPFW